MKKLISVILAVITVFSCFSLVVFAAEGDAFTKSYFVEVAPSCEQKIAITSLSGTSYVEEGKTFQFTVETVGSYVFDQTTVIKVANTHYNADVVTGNESEYGYTVYPDADGVYTIEAVNEDLYIYVANLETSSIADLKDFLLNMINFFIDWMKWFFGLK